MAMDKLTIKKDTKAHQDVAKNVITNMETNKKNKDYVDKVVSGIEVFDNDDQQNLNDFKDNVKGKSVSIHKELKTDLQKENDSIKTLSEISKSQGDKMVKAAEKINSISHIENAADYAKNTELKILKTAKDYEGISESNNEIIKDNNEKDNKILNDISNI